MILKRFCLALAAFALAGLASAAPKGGGSFLPGGNAKEPVSINSAKLDYFDKEKKLVYSGGVIATQGESKVKCSTMTIYLTREGEADAAAPKPDSGPAAGNSSIDKVECAGPVTVISKGDVGTGDHGLYDKPANKFFITGHVALSQGPNVTTGDKLAYDITSAQAVVSGNVHSLFVPGSKPDAGTPKKPKGN